MTPTSAPAPTGARLEGRTAIVTGSTSGIGAAIARTLAAHGAHVVVTGRDAGRGDLVVAEIRAAGGTADVVPADLAGSYAQLREFAAEATTAAPVACRRRRRLRADEDIGHAPSKAFGFIDVNLHNDGVKSSPPSML